jgi:hypothetical protein
VSVCFAYGDKSFAAVSVFKDSLLPSNTPKMLYIERMSHQFEHTNMLCRCYTFDNVSEGERRRSDKKRLIV